MADLTSGWKEFENIQEDNSFFPDDMQYSIKNYRKNEVLFHKGDSCDALYVVMSGSVKTEMISDSGNLIPIETIQAPRPLAPVLPWHIEIYFPSLYIKFYLRELSVIQFL